MSYNEWGSTLLLRDDIDVDHFLLPYFVGVARLPHWHPVEAKVEEWQFVRDGKGGEALLEIFRKRLVSEMVVCHV